MKIISEYEVAELTDYLTQNPEEAKVKSAWHYFSDVTERMFGDQSREGLNLPWSKTHGKIRLRPGELSLWAAVNGHGKSLLLNQIMLEAMKAGQRVMIASMEMRPEATLERMVKQAAGRNNPSVDFLSPFSQWLDGKLWVYDQLGTVKSETILAVLRFCAIALTHNEKPCPPHHVVIDSMMKCGINPDDYGRQKSFVDELCSFAMDTGVHVHLVVHSRKKDTEKTMMDKFDVFGSSDITNMADNIFSVFRNKKKEAEGKKQIPKTEIMDQADTYINCDKQRHGEWEGVVKLWFHPSGQFIADDRGRPIPFDLPTENDIEARLEREAIQSEPDFLQDMADGKLGGK